MAIHHSVRRSVVIGIMPSHLCRLCVPDACCPASHTVGVAPPASGCNLVWEQAGAQPRLHFGARIHHRAEPRCNAEVDSRPLWLPVEWTGEGNGVGGQGHRMMLLEGEQSS